MHFLKLCLPFLFFQTIALTSLSQSQKYNLVFEHGQKELNENNKATIRKATNKVVKGQHVSFYPLTFDSLTKRNVYAQIAKDQANSILKYAETVGFKLSNIPKNFPSAYKGFSVAVNMRYNINKDSLSPALQKQLLYNPLKDKLPQKKPQFFTIDPLKDTTIIGDEGTLLELKAGSLLSKVPVRIELIEYYSKADFIRNGLSTSSNRNFIETGGTIFLDAREAQNTDKQVNINPGTGLDVSFASEKKSNMQVFVKDPKRPTEMNWIIPGKSTTQTKRFQAWQMTETTLGPDGKVISEKSFNSKQAWDAYQNEQRLAAERKRKAEEKRKQEAMLAQEKRKKEALISQRNEQKFKNKMKIYDLGFINCDRFVDQERIPYSIQVDSKINAEYYMVFEDVEGVLHASKWERKADFGRAPINAKATLIAVAFIGAQAYFYKTILKIDRSNAVKVDLKPVKESYVNQQMELLK